MQRMPWRKQLVPFYYNQIALIKFRSTASFCTTMVYSMLWCLISAMIPDISLNLWSVLFMRYSTIIEAFCLLHRHASTWKNTSQLWSILFICACSTCLNRCCRQLAFTTAKQAKQSQLIRPTDSLGWLSHFGIIELSCWDTLNNLVWTW